MAWSTAFAKCCWRDKSSHARDTSGLSPYLRQLIIQPSSQLSDNLKDELAALRGFVAALQQEQQILVSGDIDRLLPVVEKKTGLAASLARFADQRQRLLSAAGLPNDRNGIETWLTGQAVSAEIRNDWASLVALTAEAQTLNESNGKLIAMRMQHNQQALNVLLAAANQATLYGPDGQTKATGGGRLFGLA